MSAATVLLPLLLASGLAWLWMTARAEHRNAMEQRVGLLDEAARHFGGEVTVGEDCFPVLAGRLADRREWKVEVIADSLVPRRLPQLWLKLTLFEKEARQGPALGVLTRPTGTEFWSMVQGFPERIAPPFEAPTSMIMRGRNVPQSDVERMAPTFVALLSDPALKEAAVTPRGVRVVRQIAEGGRGAHMVFRQMRFPVQSVAPALVATALAEAERLSKAARDGTTKTAREPELA